LRTVNIFYQTLRADISTYTEKKTQDMLEKSRILRSFVIVLFALYDLGESIKYIKIGEV
jgi:uncharacterized protein with HEPN domain